MTSPIPINSIFISHSWLSTFHKCGHKYELEVAAQILAHNESEGKPAKRGTPRYENNATDYGHFWHAIVQNAFRDGYVGLEWKTILTNAETYFILHCPLAPLATPSQKLSNQQNWKTFWATMGIVQKLLETYELFSFLKWAEHPIDKRNYSSIEFSAALENIIPESDGKFIVHIDLILWNKLEQKPEIVDIKSSSRTFEVKTEQQFSTQIYGYAAVLSSVLHKLNLDKFKKIGACLKKFSILYVDIHYKHPAPIILSYQMTDELITEWDYNIRSSLHRIEHEKANLPALVRRQGYCYEWSRLCKHFTICRMDFTEALPHLAPAYSPLDIPSLTFDYKPAIQLLLKGEG